MKRVLLLPLLLGLTTTVSAAVDPEIHKLCLKATDYVGCVKMQSAEGSGVSRVIIQEGSAISEGNTCPDTHAYIGNGYCQRVYCDTQGFRTFAAGHDQRLGGKGWACKPRWDTGGGSLRFSDIPAVRASINKSCPLEEPEIGRNNSCQNGLEEKIIKASDPPVGMRFKKIVGNNKGMS